LVICIRLPAGFWRTKNGSVRNRQPAEILASFRLLFSYGRHAHSRFQQRTCGEQNYEHDNELEERIKRLPGHKAGDDDCNRGKHLKKS
jgi:hypothetical protein